MRDFQELSDIFGTGKQLVTLNILYYRPDHSWLLQDFIWQTRDVVPQLPRVHEFLHFWQREIEATIHSIECAAQDLSGRPVFLSPGFVENLH